MRHATAEKIVNHTALEETAIVIALEPLRVRAGALDLDAKRAISCLVEPRVGDEVLVSFLADGRIYVLAVLEREAPGVVLGVEGDCLLRASGAVSLAGAEGVELVSGEAVDVVGRHVSIKSATTSFASDVLDVVAQTTNVELDRVRLAARVVDGFFDRVIQRAKRSIRIVEEMDQLRAGRIDQVARETMTLHADDAVVTARKLVKVDGGQIQLG